MLEVGIVSARVNRVLFSRKTYRNQRIFENIQEFFLVYSGF